jgi:hypothetical protein
MAKRTRRQKRRGARSRVRRQRGGAEQCAPGFGAEGSCLPPPVVDDLEQTTFGGKSANSPIEERVKRLKRAQGCTSEACLVGARDREIFFRPAKQASWLKNKHEWLDSNDILKVMKQYERHYTAFEFLGPSPADFDQPDGERRCVWDELCKFDLGRWLKRGKTLFGVIFNVDPHTSSGSHWVSVFVNAGTGHVYFFNSTGDRITPRINRFVKKVQRQSAQLFGNEYKFDSNAGVEHQMGDTECGIYALYFIHTMIDQSRDHSAFRRIFKEKDAVIRDREMAKFRDVFFNDPFREKKNLSLEK